MASKLSEKALKLIRSYPRVNLGNITALPEDYKSLYVHRRGRKKGGKSGKGEKGQKKRMTLPRIGFEGGNTPFYLQIPKEPYYRAHHLRREYPPVSLLQLQRSIDVGRLNPKEPIDLTSICNTKLLHLNPDDKEYGINLTDEGADLFAAKVNIEVQWASEMAIAAVERCGGTITTRYYNTECLRAICDPLKFFQRGIPIPRCPLPPHDALEYYTNPAFRGYLADPEKIAEARLILAQKYGYELPDIKEDPDYEMLIKQKDPRQIFYGLQPGWFVCMKDKVVIKPKDQEYVEYFHS